jgi:hypothetical protein
MNEKHGYRAKSEDKLRGQILREIHTIFNHSSHLQRWSVYKEEIVYVFHV